MLQGRGGDITPTNYVAGWLKELVAPYPFTEKEQTMKNIDITLLGCVLKYDIRGVKKALLKGANPNAQFPDSGLAALHIGAAVNNAVCVPILIAAGAPTASSGDPTRAEVLDPE